jgi:Na+-transporting NADH:ubiquinone oxidoreductase subunit F
VTGIILAPLVVSGIAAVLAALISVLDMIVNNYGIVKISINKGKKELDVKGGAPLLQLLAGNEIFLPSACGGRGSCGACKCKVISDVGPHLPTEVPYLTKEEIDENIRLSCQIKVKKNIEIEIPDVLFNVKQYEGIVEKIHDVTHDIKEVLISIGGNTIEFDAGMYVQLAAPPYAKIKGETQRAYSMSSSPSDKTHVELLVRLVPGGIVTTWVHTLLKEGQKVKIIGPFGEFHRRDTDADMICVAGGSGMAPFKSIFTDMFERKINNRDIWYFFGARTGKDMFYLDELKELEKKWDRFHFIPALSEPQSEDNWSGETGIITDVLDRYLKNKIARDKEKEGYLCGSPGMIGACNKVLLDNSIPLEKIYYDKFA